MDNWIERFWSRIDRSAGWDACWPWTAALSKAGYGQIRINGVTLYSHRLAFELYGGAILKNQVVCHRCDSPSCCNPLHLFVGTQGDNMKDCSSKGRARGKVFHGEDHPQSVLTESRVREARQKYSTGDWTVRGLAREYDVNSGTMSLVLSRKTWGHVQ